MPARKVKLVVLSCLSVFLGCKKAQEESTDTLRIIPEITYQTIDNFGAAGCWYAEGIGKYWPEEKREKIAELLFSKETNTDGSPKGIGLSAWRFNIGGGTSEQGDASGISDVNRRVESFLSADGNYDWNKQAGYQWFLKKAKYYGVEKLIAFSNTPPVNYTKNGLGFKTEKDYQSNLKEEHYGDYTNFLAEVLSHFKDENLEFDYISPVNEPQWDWYGEVGNAKQEGSPWTNMEIYKVIKNLDSVLTAQNLNSKILLPEAAQLNFLYEGNNKRGHQISNFFAKDSALYLGDLPNVSSLIAGHSYFTDGPDEKMLEVRNKLYQETKKQDIAFWQSEYSMLDEGFRDGVEGKRTPMDCALFLGKLIHTDLTVANASAWQFWNAFEPGSAASDTRYYLIALDPNKDHTNGTFTPVKNLWALGHFSYFIKPGMKRIAVETSYTDPLEAVKNLMTSAYIDEDTGTLVMVLLNYTNAEMQLPVKIEAEGYTSFKQYVTTSESDKNIAALPGEINMETGVNLPARSISTLVFTKKQ